MQLPTELMNTDIEINFYLTLFNLFWCILCAYGLKFTYIRVAKAVTPTWHVANIIPLLSLITFTVIVIVKSSLALSLGLVGALSIVRFRTPIKEPEELIFLFFAIGIGLGFGANQTLVTGTIFLVIVLMLFLERFKKSRKTGGGFNLHIDWSNSNVDFKDIVKQLEQMTLCSLSKYTMAPNEQSASFSVVVESTTDIDALVAAINTMDSNIAVVFYDANPLQ